MADLIGEMLGQYQIIDQIGMGGMATVYRAYQANMDRYVAIKVLPKQLAEDPQFFGRFEQEARTIARLENKHILPVYDYGEYNGHTYLVMRYIGTGTLKNLVTRGPLALVDSVTYFTQIADALQYAHDHGVIHRDVKTSNVLIGDSQDCYLTDFGIAKLAASASHFTGTGGVIGTPAYMSPEQCHGLPVDARSDIYSLGIVLYEMLTGAVPFEAETPVAVVLKQVNEPLPPPRGMNPSIPEGVEKVLFKALAKEPEDRYQTVKAFSDALRDAYESFTERQTVSFPSPVVQAIPEPPTATRESLPTKPMTPAQPTRPRWLLIAGVAAILIAAGIIAALALSGGDEDQNADDETTTEIGAAGEVVTPDDELSPAAPTVEATPEVLMIETEVTAPTLEATSENPVIETEVVVPPTDVPPPTEVVAPPTDVAPPLTDVPQPTIEAVAQVPDTPIEPESVWTIFTSTRADSQEDGQLIITEQGLWVSSEGGLVRFQRDGTYSKYTSADGLYFNEIQVMALDQSGHLWLGGGGDKPGVMRLEFDANGDIAFIDYYDSNTSRLGSDYIWAFLPEPDGSVLVGTYNTDKLLEKWDGQNWSTPDLPTEGLNAVGDRLWMLMRSKDGTLWAGGPNGLVRTAGETWEVVLPPDDLQGGEYESYQYTGLYEDPFDGSLWVSLLTTPDWTLHTRRLVLGDDGVWAWNTVTEDIPAPLRNGLRASDNSLWLLSDDSVVRIDNASGRRTVFDSGQGIRGEQYYDIAEDAEGTIWITTDTALAYYDGRRWISYSVENEVPEHNVVAMDEAADGTLWFVSNYGVLARYQNDTWEYIDYFDTDAYDLVVQNDVVWIGTGEGLYRYENGAKRLYSPDDSTMNSPVVLRMVVDPNNPDWLWFGTINGLHLLNTADNTIRFWSREQNELPGPGITALHFDPDGVLWVGSGYDDDWIGPGEAALLKIVPPVDPENLTWEVAAALNNPFGEPDWAVLTISDDDEGGLWLGTDESLYHWQNNRWQRFSESDGAPEGQPVGDVLVRDGVVWVSTWYNGLYRYDRAGWYSLGREGTGSYRHYNLFAASDGTLWVLTEDGVARLTGDPFK